MCPSLYAAPGSSTWSIPDTLLSLRTQPEHPGMISVTAGKRPTVQRAEWDEGMPPESTIARMSQTPCLIFFVKICMHSAVL